MSNFLICVGCERYDSQPPVPGAHADAEGFAAILTADLYRKEKSVVLLSPTYEEYRTASNDLLRAARKIDKLTFYFAGHGIEKGGEYCMALKDTESALIASTSITITSLFSLVKPLKPKSFNVIIDSCHSGAAHLGLYDLLNQKNLGNWDYTSVSVLASAGRDEYAYSNDSGSQGAFTEILLKYLGGELLLNKDRNHVGLLELGMCIGARFEISEGKQKPICWGVNLFGYSGFASNPHYVEGQDVYAVENITPTSRLGAKIRENSSKFLSFQRTLEEGFCSEECLGLIHGFVANAELTSADFKILFLNLFNLYRGQIKRSGDPATQLELYDAFITLSIAGYGDVGEDVLGILIETRAHLVAQIASLIVSNELDGECLGYEGGVAANFVGRPFRIGKLLGLLGSQLLISKTLSKPEGDGLLLSAIHILHSKFQSCLICVSDEQSASIFLSILGCVSDGNADLAEMLLGAYFEDLERHQGKVLRTSASPEQVVNYIYARGSQQPLEEIEGLASPNNVLSVLLYLAKKLGLDDEIEPWLISFDNETINFFLPDHYNDYGCSSMTHGLNYSYNLGRDVFLLNDFFEDFSHFIDSHLIANDISPIKACACVVASLSTGDRIPFVIEPMCGAWSAHTN